MYRKLSIVSLIYLLVFFLTLHTADAQAPIRGPWLWMITEVDQGGQASTNVDSLSTASGGRVTETNVATNGTQAGGIVGSYAWTSGVLPEDGDINAMLVDIGMTTQGNLDDHTSYALITVVSEADQRGVLMGANSDDSIKIWLNGEVVHTNPVNRGRGGIPTNINHYQDQFSVDLNRGNNLLMVKVSEFGGGWGMYVGINANVTYQLPDSTTPHTPVIEMPVTDHTDPSLILYFSFDELNGNQAIDHSQYQNHGTLVGNPQLVDGKFGKALKFNGETDAVEVPHHNSLTVTEAVTVMAWIHTPRSHHPATNWQGILAKGDQHPRSYSFYTERGETLQLSLDNGGAAVVIEVGGVPIAHAPGNIPSEGTFELNEWQHVASRIANGERQFWINGQRAGTSEVVTPFPGLADTASVLIGDTHEPVRNFLGLIDEVRIWNRALSEAEILQQMEQGLQSRIVETMGETSTILSFSPSPVPSPPVGQQLTLDLNITDGENIAGYQVTVQFDATTLRFVSSENADYLPTGAFVVPATVKDNTVTIVATSLAGESAGDGTLATLTFEVIAAEPSTLTITEALLSDSDVNPYYPQVKSGEITEPQVLKEDINKDGVVNIQDLVLVAANFTLTGENIADVNGDGIVNIVDLTLVAGALIETAAAPSMHAAVLKHLTANEVAQWLRAAQQANLVDPAFQRGVEVLKHLLTVLVPKETVLLANYPNPFNPETWIPYQLAKPAKVSIAIHSADGKLVRTLALGHQSAGIYQTRSRAAYWDGRNQLGEPVASGLYFYTLTAGDFNATRKMLIRK